MSKRYVMLLLNYCLFHMLLHKFQHDSSYKDEESSGKPSAGLLPGVTVIIKKKILGLSNKRFYESHTKTRYILLVQYCHT